MKYRIFMVLLTYAAHMLNAQTPEALEVTEYKLTNGMSVWLNEDHSQPKVFGAVVVKAGAKDSPNTGIPHYFEHMMFKGTDKIGTLDYEKERAYLDSIETCYDDLAKTKDAHKRKEIQQKINQLSIEAAEYVIPNEFNRLISQYGGSRLNAGTSYDYTVYMNTFSPQYMEQWAELNSERLINPVFRLFQSELETVYEEKNMYHDFIGRDAVDKLMERYFSPHPYAYPILGSTESLKNPRLSEMRQFFEEYYVASNMGLILSGDFDKEEVLPVLERTFSRIQSGEPPVRDKVPIPPFLGEEQFVVKFPVPVVNVAAFAFRGVPANHPDQVALNIVISLLNNSNGTGFLDKLMVDRKLMAAMTLNENMNEAGILGVMGIPKLVFQTRAKAKELIWREINRIKTGDFSGELFSSLKLEQKRKYVSRLEDISSRAEAMITLYSQGKSWKEYLEELDRIDALSKEDVVAVANRYFTDNFLYITKKTGKYPKDELPKPDFKPIIPTHPEAVSAFAQELEKLPVKEVTPHFLDLHTDARRIELAPLNVLYATSNPVNDIFTLDISFGIGKIEKPVLTQLAAYLTFLGTRTLSFDEFRGKLQSLGSTLNFDVTDNRFVLKVSGFDAQFEETLELVALFLREVEPDNKKIKQLADEEKVIKKAFFKSPDQMAYALLEKIKYEDRSTYLTKLSHQEIKKLKGEELIGVFQEIQQVACEYYYAGTLPDDQVAGLIKEKISSDKTKANSSDPVYRDLADYEDRLIYIYHMPDATQSIICSYSKGEAVKNEATAHIAKLFSSYLAGDMSSLLFQEIREYRSLAYRAQGRYKLPPRIHWNREGELTTLLSTQADKTLDALEILDQLIREMPLKPERLPAIKQTILNESVNNYPVFRKIPQRVAELIRNGYTQDPDISLLEDIRKMGMEEVDTFYQANIRKRPVVYMIIGNMKKIDQKQLSQFGKLIKVSKDELYK